MDDVLLKNDFKKYDKQRKYDGKKYQKISRNKEQLKVSETDGGLTDAASTCSLPCPADTPWEKITPRTEKSIIMEGLKSGRDSKLIQFQQQFNSGMHELDFTEERKCVNFPDGFSKYEAVLSLNLETGSTGIVVVHASVVEANFSDEQTEECLIDYLTGQVLSAEGLGENRYVLRYKMLWFK